MTVSGTGSFPQAYLSYPGIPLFRQPVCQLFQFSAIQIGYQAVMEAVAVAVNYRVSPKVLFFHFHCTHRADRPNEYVDDMFVPAVDQSCHRAAINEIQTAAGQWKTLRGEILDVRGEVELAAEPGF